jgi:hypothetical protein
MDLLNRVVGVVVDAIGIALSWLLGARFVNRPTGYIENTGVQNLDGILP